MSGRFDAPGKKTVRSKWNTPLLKYIHDTHHIKYRYLGLPGVELIDVTLWKEMLNYIIAFELPTTGSNEREDITLMKKNLTLLGIEYQAYYGSIEHVIINREDIDGNKYNQDNFIDLYNLDFCNEITSKIPTAQGKKCLRFELIRTIFTDQHSFYQRNNSADKFIILLTARNQSTSKTMRDYFFGNGDTNDLYTSTNNFVTKASEIRAIPNGNRPLTDNYSWVLKSFIYNTIRQY